MQDAEALSHEYAISGDMLHQALAELDKQACKETLPFQSETFKQERTRLFEALLKADRQLVALCLCPVAGTEQERTVRQLKNPSAALS